MPPVTPRLFLSSKNQAAANNDQIILFRELERWSSQLQSAAGGGGGGYASLTGPGQTTTPGDLTQAGGFTVNALPSSTGVLLNGHEITLQTSAGNINLTDPASGHLAGISMTSNAGGEIQINQTGEPQITNLGNTGNIFIGAGVSFASVENVKIQPSGSTAIITANVGFQQLTVGMSGGGSSLAWNDTNPFNVAAVTVKSGLVQISGNQVTVASPNAGGSITVGNITSLTLSCGVQICGQADTLYFFSPGGSGAAAKQTVTGSRGGNAALASLLTALSNYGLVTNSSTP